MHHLYIMGNHGFETSACRPDQGHPLTGWTLDCVNDDHFDLDGIDCPDCKGSIYFEAAERIVMLECLRNHDLIGQLLDKIGQERITRRLGDHSVITEAMTNREKLKAVSATLSHEEKVEHLARIHDMVSDTCLSCGGSLAHNEHAENCLGPDPDEWHLKMSAEQVDAELRVCGTDPVASAKKFRTLIDGLMAKAKARVENPD